MTTNYEPIRNEAADLLALWQDRQGDKAVAALHLSHRAPVEAALVVALLCDRMDAGERADLLYGLKQKLPRHLESCREQNEGGTNGNAFWVCGEDCPTRRERASR